MDILSFTVPFDRPTPYDPPTAYAAALRRGTPVIRTTTAAGTQAWVVIGADAVQQVLSDRRFGINQPGTPVDGESLRCDGEEHARLRRVISRGLRARTLESLRSRFDGMAAEFVSEIRRAGPPAELVTGLSRPLTLAMITELLGVPVSDRAKFHRWAEATSMSAADAESYAETWVELFGFLGDLIAAKRVEPEPDLLSDLIAVCDTGDGQLNDRELVLAAVSLLAGGQLTTANALSIGVIKLLRAGGLGSLRDGQAVAVAVEEVLRHQVGISGEALPRWALADVDLGGRCVSKGDMVIVRLEAANRDPARFDDPDRFDPRRIPNPHLKFGHGPHRCIGAALARMVLVAAVTALADQLPDLALTCSPDEIPWTDHPLDSGPAALPVAW
ncbi:MAG: cytochrome P450 [Pseudonocardia sp.]